MPGLHIYWKRDLCCPCISIDIDQPGEKKDGKKHGGANVDMDKTRKEGFSGFNLNLNW